MERQSFLTSYKAKEFSKLPKAQMDKYRKPTLKPFNKEKFQAKRITNDAQYELLQALSMKRQSLAKHLDFQGESTNKRVKLEKKDSNKEEEIKNVLLKFFNLYEIDQFNDNLPKKEFSFIKLGYTSKQLQQEALKIIPAQLPELAYNFDQNKAFFTNNQQNIVPRIKPVILASVKEMANEITVSVKTKQLKTESYHNFNDIPFSIYNPEKEALKRKMQEMNQKDLDKYEVSQVQKQWQGVVKNVVRNFRVLQKDKLERDQNWKKIAQQTARERKKVFLKSLRVERESQTRARRLHKECLQFWKRRERELNDLKKKKDKIETELQRREEEEKESLLQKKRLETLMRHADIYAHFMGKKLGIEVEQSDLPSILNTYDDIQIHQNVDNLLNEHQQHIQEFEQEQLLDFSQVKPNQISKLQECPQSFKGTLKEYQFKGLKWLDNLYDQGINGILADEMGLGKTIQAIALLAHISENKGNWGPFLVIAPSSTLHNWREEVHRFCPVFKVLPYWGSLKDRKMLRKYFSSKSMGSKDSSFHIVVTSYQLVVLDERTFNRIKWQYIILDEAQAIKSVSSQRWNTLLAFQARNKLLLTGTPIQNSMAELWALLHFIMPSFFDSHEHFQEWFSKDIEAHSQDMKSLNKLQLERLHKILQPFMLRRVKKDVEHEIGQKSEILINCQMTARQRELYDVTLFISELKKDYP